MTLSDVIAGADDIDIMTIPSSSGLQGHVDTQNTISFEATSEVQGGNLKCCANHIAIPGGGGSVYDEDPDLTPLCVNTTLLFPGLTTIIYNKFDKIDVKVVLLLLGFCCCC